MFEWKAVAWGARVLSPGRTQTFSSCFPSKPSQAASEKNAWTSASHLFVYSRKYNFLLQGVSLTENKKVYVLLIQSTPLISLLECECQRQGFIQSALDRKQTSIYRLLHAVFNPVEREHSSLSECILHWVHMWTSLARDIISLNFHTQSFTWEIQSLNSSTLGVLSSRCFIESFSYFF